MLLYNLHMHFFYRQILVVRNVSFWRSYTEPYVLQTSSTSFNSSTELLCGHRHMHIEKSISFVKE